MLRILYHSGQWLSAIALMVLVTMTVSDVILRTLFNSPIYGSNEVANLLLTLSVGAGLVMTTSTRSHIRVDLMEGPLLRKFGNKYHTVIVFFEVLGTLLFAAMLAVYTYEAWEFGEATVVLEWPVAPVFCVAGLFSAISAFYIFKPMEREG